MFMVSRPQPRSMKSSLGGCHRVGRGLPGRVRAEKCLEAVLVDPDAVAHRLERSVALDRAGEIELGVEGNEIEAVEDRKSRTVMM